jgi:hypothetical protein
MIGQGLRLCNPTACRVENIIERKAEHDLEIITDHKNIRADLNPVPEYHPHHVTSVRNSPASMREA